MVRCPSCAAEVDSGSRFCPQCGSAVDVQGESTSPADGGTVTTPQPGGGQTPGVRVLPGAQPPARYEPSGASSSDSIDAARFTPGTMLTDRYRIVGMLGKGGMGEVYRADDLKLRQPVALKFLPSALTRDQRKLDRFHHEVRVARQVSHPNVCRVYDIGEADGQPFISMEYVDGEDLASVLRRMGKPSKDKALQIARQLCAGLAAAHDKGVLHRDLKPHNVMIDGTGRVRITDFGLAGFVEDFAGRDVAAGTPAYMAPEQLAGREVSVKSDLYSLGVVLFELFTGRRLFEGATREQMRRTMTTASITTLSSGVEDLDPAVERVILRCLEPSPAARPTSALAVAAALPGGDPLAAALAAGETPDPEMVAAAGDVGGLRPGVAVPCLVTFLVGIIAVAVIHDKSQVVRLDHPPEVLAGKAREIVEALGYQDRPVDRAMGFTRDIDYLTHIRETDKSATRWDQLADAPPAIVQFWYRQSSRHMVPQSQFLGQANVRLSDPPADVSGMVNVVIDAQGRLLSFLAVPPERDASAEPAPDPDWTKLFERAGLDPEAFTATEPQWVPPVWSDVRAAWEGACPGRKDVPLRVEAAAYRGKPVFFRLVWPWTHASQMESEPVKTGEQAADILLLTLFLMILVGGAAVARRNARLGRGDRRGAGRLGWFVLIAMLMTWLFRASHVPSFGELALFIQAIGFALFVAALVWLLYVAIEPFVRRRWPHVMISWNRLLSGRWRDPQVGRDILFGCLAALVLQAIPLLRRLASVWLGSAPPAPELPVGDALLGVRQVAAAVSDSLPWALFLSLGFFFIFYLFRIVLRRQWLAAVAFVLVFSAGSVLRGESWLAGATGVLFPLLFLVLLIRFGHFVLLVTFFLDRLFHILPFSLDISSWHAGTSLFALAFFAAVGVFGFYTALAGRPIFRDEFAEA